MIFLLYDGHCGLCRRSIRLLQRLDWFHRLHVVDFWDETKQREIAPDLRLEDLNRAMHVRFSSLPPRGGGLGRGGQTLTGFFVFRTRIWHLPLFWPLAPLLYLPGIPWIGQRIYTSIAARHNRCTHEKCRL